MIRERKTKPFWLIAPLILGACAQIVGIEDPKPIPESSSSGSSSSGSGSSSSGSTSSGSAGSPWIGWRMPNPASAGLPNPSSYAVEMSNEVVYDQVTHLFWQQSVDGKTYTFDQAQTYCENLTLGGYSDWRVPFRIELVSLVDYTRKYPAIDSIFPNTPSNAFWSASKYSDVSGHNWTVQFDEGRTDVKTTDTPLRVRCVR